MKRDKHKLEEWRHVKAVWLGRDGPNSLQNKYINFPVAYTIQDSPDSSIIWIFFSLVCL